MHRRRFFHIFYISAIIILVIATYLFASKRTTAPLTGTSPTPTPEEVTWPLLEAAKQLVEKFETLQKAGNGIEVMKLFTPPQTPSEAAAYQFIMGLDLPGKGERLYVTAGMNNYLQSYTVTSVEEQSNEIVARVKELRKFYDNSTTEWSSKEKQTVIEIKRYGINEFIDKYYFEGKEPNKYSALYPY